ncbi:metallophosphoesterase family protein [Spirosoma linguale]|uniref:Phosphoesterase n=1 Tax=Spirosoma linguale (strain ATCC 33905 / DSM 74 / LMG 10896 / Claus 1) TaxID=504472 RepID=D2QKI5_SPILD|nr:phosphodiesterase, MJ0936 family [Spirosoma linguale DSM 74]
MTRIGFLSDTHSYLDPQVFTHFEACDEVWHAGDVGNMEVADALKRFRPLRIVCGNIDNESIELPLNQRFTLEGFDIWMTHIGGTPPNYNPTTRPQLKASRPDIFICGHSHILKVVRDPAMNNLLFMNPGAAGKTGFHKMRTVLRFSLDAGRILDMQVIELGKK